jgi:hypothetical protein
MQMINQELARLRREDLLRAAAADRFASLARRARRHRMPGADTRWFARRSERGRLTELGRVPLFQGLARGDLRTLARHADRFTAREGTVLARETHPEPQFVVLDRGVAEATRDGRRLAIHASGDHFGELTVLEGTPQVPTVTALTDVTGYVFGRRSFWDAVNAVPALAVRLATRLAEDLARSQRAMVISAQYRSADPRDPDPREAELCDSVPSSSSSFSA